MNNVLKINIIYYLRNLSKRYHDNPTSSFMDSASPSGNSRVNSVPRASERSAFRSSLFFWRSIFTRCLSISPLLMASPTFFMALVWRRTCRADTNSLAFSAWATCVSTRGCVFKNLKKYV